MTSSSRDRHPARDGPPHEREGLTPRQGAVVPLPPGGPHPSMPRRGVGVSAADNPADAHMRAGRSGAAGWAPRDSRIPTAPSATTGPYAVGPELQLREGARICCRDPRGRPARWLPAWSARAGTTGRRGHPPSRGGRGGGVPADVKEYPQAWHVSSTGSPRCHRDADVCELTTDTAGGALFVVAVSGPGVTAFGASSRTLTKTQGVETEQSASALAGQALGLSCCEQLVVKDVITDGDGSAQVSYNRTSTVCGSSVATS